jgi:hypothetical protein
MVGRLIEKALHDGEDPFEEKYSRRTSGYSSAMTATAKRMKIPANGVW